MVIFEKLIVENNDIILGRALLKFNIVLKKYPEFGVWSYFFNTKKGVIISDPGPKYDSLCPFMRSKFRSTDNIKSIMGIMEKYFPGKTIKEIVISHYHFDHSENAPELQDKIYRKFGNRPKIRIHEKDTEKKKFLKLFDDSLEKTLSRTGRKNYELGKFLEDGELLEGTNFMVKHLPGHTSGSIGFLSKQYKITISGSWVLKEDDKFKYHFFNIINEDKSNLEKSVKSIRIKGYKHYFYHPMPKLELKVLNKINKKI